MFFSPEQMSLKCLFTIFIQPVVLVGAMMLIQIYCSLTQLSINKSRDFVKRTAPGLGSGTGWLYVYHCCVSRLTSRYRPLKASSTWSMVNAHTAELPEAPLYLHTNTTCFQLIYNHAHARNNSLLISRACDTNSSSERSACEMRILASYLT